MEIDIRNITDNGLLVTFTKNAAFFPVLKDLAKKTEYIFTSPVTTEISLNYTSENDIEVTGLISTTIDIACARCLEIFNYSLKAEFKLLFSDQEPAVDDPESQDEDGIEIFEDTIETEYYSGTIIQLKNLIQEQVVLALPQKILCSESCKGLCPKCGGNLNKSECHCVQDVGHPAFAALKALKGSNKPQ